jgi:hypothetical protein
MREVYHVLVEHSIWIAKDKCVAIFVLRHFIQVIQLFACCGKEHRINNYIFTRDETLLSIKGLP